MSLSRHHALGEAGSGLKVKRSVPLDVPVNNVVLMQVLKSCCNVTQNGDPPVDVHHLYTHTHICWHITVRANKICYKYSL